MTPDEANQFFRDQLSALWPQWEPTSAEIEIWTRRLLRLDRQIAISAIREAYEDGDSHFRRPNPQKFNKKVALRLQNQPKRAAKRGDPTTNTWIECVEHPDSRWIGVRHGVYVLPTTAQDNPDYVLAAAEAARQKCENIYLGRWIVVRDLKEQAEPLQESARAVTGKAALEQAVLNIWSGSETPGQRFLKRIITEERRADIKTMIRKAAEKDLPF